MDPALWELLQEGEAYDEVAAIIRLDDPQRLPVRARLITRLGDTIATCRLPRQAIEAVHEEDPIASLKAPRWLEPEPEWPLPEWAEDVADIALRPTDWARSPQQSATGKGVVLGVIDWGFDFAHPDFLNPDGSTRILALWDQRSQADRAVPQPYGYGVVHITEAINQALRSPDPYQALGYRPAPDAHGTHVASIAGGNGGGGGPLGMAPAVEFVFVHLASFGAQARANLGDSATLLEAVDFIAQVAGDRPCVINTSLGRHGEQHDGTTLVEQGLDGFLTAAPGRALVQSCGNYFDRNIHTQGQLRPGGRHRFRWETHPADVTPNELEVWYAGRDRLLVELRSPGDDLVVTVPLGDRATLAIQGQRIGTLYHRHREPNTLDNHIDIFLYPTAPAGAWVVTLMGDDVLDGRFHVWIERDAALPYSQSRLDPLDAVTQGTTGTICNGYRTLAVGAYNPHDPDWPLAPFSSAGPTRDGRIKPDLVGPGVAILAARSRPHPAQGDAPRLMRKSGTSMATPHVAGTVALMFEAAGRLMPIDETRYWLLSTTDAAPHEPPERVGSGYLNSDRAVAAVRSAPASPARDHWPTDMDMEATMAPEPWHTLTISATPSPESSPETLPPVEVRIADHVLALTASVRPLHRSTSLDEALTVALAQPGSTAIAGDLLGDRFVVYALEPAQAVANLPPVIQLQTASALAAVILGGTTAYFPANPTAPGDRWVAIADAADFYRLSAARQAIYRRPWVQALNQAPLGYSAAQLSGFSMPTLRLLVAHHGDQTVRVRRVNQPDRRFLGAVTRRLSDPRLTFPLQEPACYLPVIAQAEGGLETINAYDLGAGISLGPIQFNCQRGAVFQFLGLLWEGDRALFDAAFGGFNWAMERQGDGFNLLVNPGTEAAMTLRGVGDRANEQRNIGYFQAGQPHQTGFSQIDADWRLRLTEQFRRVLVWPHVQAMVEQVSADWLQPGLAIIHRAGIPPLGALPDRDTFVLKALLMSAYVRYSGCLRSLLNALASAPTAAQKLAQWRTALATLAVPCPRLETRLDRQERAARVLFDTVIQPQPTTPPTPEDLAEDLAKDLAKDLAIEDLDQADSRPITWVDLADWAIEADLEPNNGGISSEKWLDQLLQETLSVPAALLQPGLPLSPAVLFDAFVPAAQSALRRHYEQFFELVAAPGQAIGSAVEPGQLLVRRALGEGALAHVAVVVSDTVIPSADLGLHGLTGEPGRGGYVQVIEAGACPHSRRQGFARRLVDGAGRLERNQLLLRLRRPAFRPEQLDESAEGADSLGLEDDDADESLLDGLDQTPPPLRSPLPPRAIPPHDPAPFAPLPEAGSYWPIITTHALGRTVSYQADDGSWVGRRGRSWLADRSGGGRYHIGIDLFANFDDPVVAIAAGEIVRFYPFCCGQNKTTNALFVAHANVVVNYGEVAPDSLRRTGLRVGSPVVAGQVIGYVGRNPGGSTMIHFETYTLGTRTNSQWLKTAPRPANLLNPTRYLLHLQAHGLVGTVATSPGPSPATPAVSTHRRHPNYIRWVQTALNQVANAGLVVDGVAGARTRAAVRSFQSSHGLVADGLVGGLTEAALIAAGATPPPTISETWQEAEPTVLHQCQPGEGPPAAVPDPEGRGLHPLIYRGTGARRSRNPSVGDAQQLLNRFLAQVATGVDRCEDRSPAVRQVIAQGRATLQRSGQYPLTVDCRFGASTETATKMFQACQGLTQDGKIGPLTWAKLVQFRPTAPPPRPPSPLPGGSGLTPTRWAPILRRSISATTTLRTGNGVTFLINGPATFRAMVDAIRATQGNQHYIYLLGWSLIDDFDLITPLPPGTSPGSLTAQRLFSDAASRGVQIRAMLWDQVGTQNSAQVRRINALPTGAAILDNATPNPISGFGSHHQKVLVVKHHDHLVAFCGGIDIHRDRLQAVSGGSVSSGTAGAPLHDVHCRVVGPAAYDLLQTFIRRWDHHPDHVTLDRTKGALLGRREPVPAAIAAPGSLSSTGNTSAVCIARTFNPVTRGTTVPRERDIRNLLITAIRHARRFIYMEEQYLIHPVAATELRSALPRLAHLTILIPGSEISDMPCVWKLRREFLARLTVGLSPADAAKVRVFLLITPPPTSPPTFGRHTYVHAKTWIFDDELAVIGSANCNRRGWEHDSEVNAFIFDDRPGASGRPTFAQALRSQLWAEHLNLPVSAVLDGVASAGRWLSPPTGAKVMRYNPTAGRDRTPDTVCDRLLNQIDPMP